MRIALLAATAVCCLPAPGAAAVNDGAFGVNPGDLFRLPETQWDAHLEAISDDGVQAVRMGAWWPDLEPGPPVDGQHRYSWSDIDRQVVALARHGLRWEPLLCFSATWGSQVDGDYSAAPDGTENFAGFAAALARRYGHDGSFWAEHPELPALPVTSYEIWNEPNATRYWHPGEAGDYADLYAAAHAAIHGADGAARVVVGGLAASGPDGVTPADDFLRRMYAHRPDLEGSVDAVGLHPFARDPQGVYRNVATFRHDLDDIAGKGIPIEVTEIGWPATEIPEQIRASYLAQVAEKLARSDCGIDRVMPYAWVEQSFGIANQDGSPRPSATAYSNAIGATDSHSGTTTICSALQLRVRVRPQRRARRVVVVASCSPSCRLRVELRAPQVDESAERVTRHRVRHQRVTLDVAKPVSRRRAKIQVRVTATGRDGRRATRRHVVRLRPRLSRRATG